MGAPRYGISLRVFNLISHSFAALTCQTDIELNTRREIPYLPEAMYYFSYYMSILMTTFLTIFRGFPKFLKNHSEGQKNVFVHFSNISDHYLKIAEDERRRSENVLIIHQQI